MDNKNFWENDEKFNDVLLSATKTKEYRETFIVYDYLYKDLNKKIGKEYFYIVDLLLSLSLDLTRLEIETIYKNYISNNSNYKD